LLQDASRQRELSDGVTKGNNLLAQNDFDGSLKAFYEVWTAARNKPPADLAMYSMGLIYAHPQNPKRDLQKAVYYFDQTIQNSPTSPLAAQARVWITVLQDSENAREEFEKSRQEIERTKQMIEKSKQIDIEIDQKRRERRR
jgi:hypothetical protein